MSLLTLLSLDDDSIDLVTETVCHWCDDHKSDAGIALWPISGTFRLPASFFFAAFPNTLLDQASPNNAGPQEARLDTLPAGLLRLRNQSRWYGFTEQRHRSPVVSYGLQLSCCQEP